MVSNLSLAGMVLQAVLGTVLVVVAAVYLRRAERIALKPVLVGAAVFLLFSQILEKALHVYILQLNATTAALLKNSWLFGVYGALAAGIFEELGRYVGFRWWLKRRRSWGDGLAFGLGHGGVEALLIAVVGGSQSLALALMYNQGTLEQALGTGVPPEKVQQLIAVLVQTPFHMFVLGGLERIPAFVLQLALSILVLHGVRLRRFRYVLYAILLHAAVDFAPALYQAKVLSIYVVEAMLIIVGIGAFMYLRRMQRIYSLESPPE